jgi:hypothetical protein
MSRALELVAIDGAPVSSEPGTAARDVVLLPPGGRAEFVVVTPRAGAIAQLVSRPYDAGPDGAPNPKRVIANIVGANEVPGATTRSSTQRAAWHFTGLAAIRPARVRRLYFVTVQPPKTRTQIKS